MVRKNQPLVTVRSESFTDVAEGETITTLLLDAVSMDDNEPPENWAPTIASTWFVVISFVAAAAAAWEFVWSSSLNITIGDRKSTRLNSSHQIISYAVFCLKKKKN